MVTARKLVVLDDTAGATVVLLMVGVACGGRWSLFPSDLF